MSLLSGPHFHTCKFVINVPIIFHNPHIEQVTTEISKHQLHYGRKQLYQNVVNIRIHVTDHASPQKCINLRTSINTHRYTLGLGEMHIQRYRENTAASRFFNCPTFPEIFQQCWGKYFDLSI